MGSGGGKSHGKIVEGTPGKEGKKYRSTMNCPLPNTDSQELAQLRLEHTVRHELSLLADLSAAGHGVSELRSEVVGRGDRTRSPSEATANFASNRKPRRTGVRWKCGSLAVGVLLPALPDISSFRLTCPLPRRRYMKGQTR